MVTESIFHNFVVNDAEGAERIAEVLDDSMSETTKGGFAEIKKDGVDFTYISDPEELKELVAKNGKRMWCISLLRRGNPRHLRRLT